MHLTGRTSVIAWLGLLVLTALSFTTSVIKPSLAVETSVALAIATVKAGWVALVFMHLLEARFANRMTILVAFLLVALLASLMLTDVLLRHTMPPKPLAAAEGSAPAARLTPAQSDEAQHQRAQGQHRSRAHDAEHVHAVPPRSRVEAKAAQQVLVGRAADPPF